MSSFLKSLLSKTITINQAKQIHAKIFFLNLVFLEPFLLQTILKSSIACSTVISQYVHGILLNSRTLNPLPWSWAIRYFSSHAHYHDVLQLYSQMQRSNIPPTSFAISSAVRGCARIAHRFMGDSIHAQCFKFGFPLCVYAQTSLVDFYSKLEDIDSCRRVFDTISFKNVVSWNSLLSGYVKTKDITVAQKLFDEMPVRDIVSWNTILAGYTRLKNMKQAERIFQTMPKRNCASWNTMINGYMETGKVISAREKFDAMQDKTIVSWVTMISGYAQNNMPTEAIRLFTQMITTDKRLIPDKKTITSVISACSQVGDMESASWIESYIESTNLELDDHLRTALIDLYAKGGEMKKAYTLFKNLTKIDVVAYSAMIYACGINGNVSSAVKLWEEMIGAGVNPNLVTFTGMLTACNHAGLVEEGLGWFERMREYGVAASRDHYAIVVDMCGRAGRIREAFEVVERMPMEGTVEMWGALLLACGMYGEVGLGEIAARKCFQMEPNNGAHYAVLARIYSGAGRWDDSKRIRRFVERKKMLGAAGCSWS